MMFVERFVLIQNANNKTMIARLDTVERNELTFESPELHPAIPISRETRPRRLIANAKQWGLGYS